MVMSIGAQIETWPPESFDQPPGLVVDGEAVDELVARPQQSGSAKRQHRLAQILADDMLHRLNADLAGERPHLRVDRRGQSERDQLVLGAEDLREPVDVLRELRRGSGAAVERVDRTNPRIPQRLNDGVAVLRRVTDLRDVDDAGRSRIDHAKRRHQHAGIGVGRLEDGGQCPLDVAIVVGLEQAIDQDAAHEPLIGMAVGVDEARDDDAIAAIDHGNGFGRDIDVGLHLADFAVLDQQVAIGEVADLFVERQDDRALDEDAARRQQPDQIAVRPCAAALPDSVGATATPVRSPALDLRKLRRDDAGAAVLFGPMRGSSS